MTTFTTQVELHDANTTSYQQLVKEMKQENFEPSGKKNTTGRVEFKRRGRYEIQEVIDAVLRAASKTGKKFSFTVMKDKNIEKLVPREKLVLQ